MTSSRRLLHLMVGFGYLLILAPVVMVVITSFFDQEMVYFPPQGWTLHWYGNALSQREFASGLIVSLEVALLATLIGVPLGTIAAYSLVRADFPGKRWVTMLLLGPLAVPGVVAGTALYLFYLRVQNNLPGDITGSLPGLVSAHVLLTIPWTVRVVLSSLQGLDLAAEEAAANLGARPRTVFLRITLPQMRAGLVAAGMFSFIQSFENLEFTLLLVGPGKTTLPIVILNYLEFRMDPTLSAVATIQIAIVALLMLVTDRFVKLSRLV